MKIHNKEMDKNLIQEIVNYLPLREVYILRIYGSYIEKDEGSLEEEKYLSNFTQVEIKVKEFLRQYGITVDDYKIPKPELNRSNEQTFTIAEHGICMIPYYCKCRCVRQKIE